MDVTTSRRLTRAAWALLIAVALAAGFDTVSWWRAGRLADRVAAAAETPPRDGDPPALRLAHAAALAERGETDAALGLYRLLQSDATVGAAARYNGANLLMRQATAARESAASAGQSLTMIELAKQAYRDLLRADPEHWDARYNLERAQRLVPDPEETEVAAPSDRRAERAATTMRGF